MKRAWGVAEWAEAHGIDKGIAEEAIADGLLDVHRADGRRILLSDEIDEDVIDALRDADDFDECDDEE